MSQDWDFYFSEIEDEPALIFLDLGIAEEAPIEDLPCLALLSVTMRALEAEGLSTSEESDDLRAIEEALETELESGAPAAYVGRTTSGGTRDFYVYVDAPEAWSARASILMAGFPGYEYETATLDDPGWDTYFAFLHPDPIDMQKIHNARVCRALQENGDSLEAEREIEHWAYLPTEDARAEFIEQANAMGYAAQPSDDDEDDDDDSEEEGDDAIEADVESESDDDDDDEPRFCVRAVRMDVPSFDGIDAVTLPLFELAEALGGDYDGWETRLVKP